MKKCVDTTAFTVFSNSAVCNGTQRTAGVALSSLNCSCNTSRLLNNPLLLLTVSTRKRQIVHALLYPEIREESFLFSQVKFLKCEKQRKLTRQTHRGSLYGSDQRYWFKRSKMLQNAPKCCFPFPNKICSSLGKSVKKSLCSSSKTL